MFRSRPKEISNPPFPPLKWDEFCWRGTDVLPAWAGFQSRRGDYGAVDRNEPSDGSVSVIVTPRKERRPPSAEQAAAYRYLQSRQDAIRDAVLHHLFGEYPGLRQKFEAFLEPEDLDEVMPSIESPHELRALIGLASVLFHDVAKDDIGYVGLELGCTWDMEHGLGVMLHQSRIVAFGGADSAILEWIAEEDRRQ